MWLALREVILPVAFLEAVCSASVPRKEIRSGRPRGLTRTWEMGLSLIRTK